MDPFIGSQFRSADHTGILPIFWDPWSGNQWLYQVAIIPHWPLLATVIKLITPLFLCHGTNPMIWSIHTWVSGRYYPVQWVLCYRQDLAAHHWPLNNMKVAVFALVLLACLGKFVCRTKLFTNDIFIWGILHFSNISVRVVKCVDLCLTFEPPPPLPTLNYASGCLSIWSFILCPI